MERTLVASETRSNQVTYGVAVLCAAAGLLIRLPLNSILEDRVPYITFFLATAVSSTFGGRGPGLVTTFLGALLCGIFVVAPTAPLGTIAKADFLGLLLFVAISSFIAYLAGKRIDAERHENALRILFEQTFVSIGDAVITTDNQKRVRLMNPVAERLTAWSEEEARGRLIDEVFRIFEEGTDVAAEIPVARILKTGEATTLATHTELLPRSGKRIPIDDSGAPIRSSSGAIVGAVLVFRDIADRRHDERALQAANEELTHFTLAATHDFKEPLRTLSAFAQLVLIRLAGKVDEQTESHLQHIQNAAIRLDHLLEGLLQFTSIRESEEEVEAVRVDAEEILGEVLGSLRVAIEESGATVTHEPLPAVMASPYHVGQLFQNLVGNALKYGKPGVVPVVHISAEWMGKDWTIAVKDNGIGISPDYYAAVFAPFKRLHGSDIPGAGIGLAICKRIVKRYGGHISVSANPAGGSIFSFTLPSG